MIGNQQRKQLESMAAAMAMGDPKEIQFRILRKRYKVDRNSSTGYPIIMVIKYLDNGDIENMGFVSMCREHYSAVDKAKELARYLRDTLKVDGERVKVKDESS